MARLLVKTFQAEKPVGTVLNSMLTEAQFQTEYGLTWVLADGQSVAGSKYQTITGNANIPDLRGRFLRGKNNGRGTGSNPDGEFALGQEQGQGTAKNGLSATSTGSGNHRHGIIASNHAADTTGSIATSSSHNEGITRYTNYDGTHTHPITIGAGNNETRPSNTCVNYFIKIN